MERTIFCVVLVTHLLALFCLEVIPTKQTNKRIQIKEVRSFKHSNEAASFIKEEKRSLPPSIPSPSLSSNVDTQLSSQKSPQESPSKITKPPVKESKKPLSKKDTKKPPPSQDSLVKEKHSKEKREILAKLDKTLTSLEKIAPSSTSTITVPKLPTLTITTEAETGTEEGNYIQLLSSFLEQQLKLPEEGAVKVRLSILSNGKITNLTILSSKNRKNEDYLKNKLQALALPCFNRDAEELNYTIIFTHE